MILTDLNSTRIRKAAESIWYNAQAIDSVVADQCDDESQNLERIAEVLRELTTELKCFVIEKEDEDDS